MAFKIKGLNHSGYYLNNQIVVEIPPLETNNSGYITIDIHNRFNNNKSLISRISYFNNNILRFDIAPIIKSVLGTYPENNNYNEIEDKVVYNNFANCQIRVIRYNNIGIEVDTDFSFNIFLKGGKRTQGSNFDLPINTVLKYGNRIAYWDGYPISEMYINGAFNLARRTNIDNILNKVLFPLYNENCYYIKFLNQLGSYSYWMFYGKKSVYSSSAIGYSNNFNDIVDFGSNESITNTINARIPFEFSEIIPDLNVSNDVFLFSNNKWIRLVNKGNSFTKLDNKRAYDVEFKFEIPISFNPSNLI